MPRDMNMTTLANAAAAVDAQESTTPQPLPEQVSTKAQNSTVDATSSVAKSVATAAAAATEDVCLIFQLNFYPYYLNFIPNSKLCFGFLHVLWFP